MTGELQSMETMLQVGTASAPLLEDATHSNLVLMFIGAEVEAKEIFGANVKRLEELKHKYDPDNLFSHGTRLIPRPLVVMN